MKFLLTSGGIQNDSQRRALVDLLGKPIAEAHALCIPTAVYGMKEGPYHAYSFITGTGSTPMCELGFKSVGVLELTALPSLDESLWVPLVERADVLLVNGGDPLFLNYWMKQSGLAARLPALNAVYVGLSAGSMVLTPRIGQAFVEWTPPGMASDETLGLVDFSIFPHLNHELLPENTLNEAVRWAAEIRGPAYAIDDQTAIQVIDRVVEVISEGNWKRFN